MKDVQRIRQNDFQNKNTWKMLTATGGDRLARCRSTSRKGIEKKTTELGLKMLMTQADFSCKQNIIMGLILSDGKHFSATENGHST